MPLPIEKQLEVYNAVKHIPEMLNKVQLTGQIELHKVLYKVACNEFITHDEDTKKVKEHAMLLSTRNEPVLVCGESGTGKELIARILHGERKGEFVAVNTCAVTDTLFESELFGHVRGSFTGAERDRDGLIKQTESERGDTGTLFLDEIGDLPLHLQPKFLRVIQNRTYRKVGSNNDLPVRCRIIAATHQDLPRLIKEHKFRLDLYERLNVFSLYLKPVRQRACDVSLFLGSKLWEHVYKLDEENCKNGMTHGFSGNVRQLQNIKLRAEVFGIESITREDIQ